MDESGHAAESGKPSPEPSVGLDQTALDKAVLLEQIRVLYQTHTIVFVNLVNASLTAYLLRDLLPVGMFVGWIGLFCIVVLARFLDCRRYLRAPRQADLVERWGWRYAAGATATGCLWGLTAAGILITPDPAYHAFIAFVVGGMMAGAVAGDSAFLPALIGFSVPACLPVIFAFFARGDPMSITMGLMITAFTAVLGLVGFRANHWITSIARREIIQRGLAADLERRIAERQAAERELHRSNGILQAVAASATEILRSLDVDHSIPKVLELIGRSMGVRSAHLYANNDTANFALFIHHMWNTPGMALIIDRRNLWQSDKAQGPVSVPAYLLSSVRLRPVGVFAADGGGFRARWTHHDSFLDHVHHVFGAERVEKEDMVGLAGSKDLTACGHHFRVLGRGPALRADAERHRHIAGTPFRHADARHFQVFVDIGQGILIFFFDPEQEFAIGIEWPRIRLFLILLLGDSPDLGRGGYAVNAAASLGQSVYPYPFVVNGKAHGFDKGPDGAGIIRMGEHHAVHAGGEHLVEHPGVGMDRLRIHAVYGHVDDNRRRAMTASVRAAGCQPAHVLLQALYVEGSVLHVVADVIRVGLRVFHSLLVGASSSRVRAGVVDRLAFCQELDGLVDALRFCGLGHDGRGDGG